MVRATSSKNVNKISRWEKLVHQVFAACFMAKNRKLKIEQTVRNLLRKSVEEGKRRLGLNTTLNKKMT